MGRGALRRRLSSVLAVLSSFCVLAFVIFFVTFRLSVVRWVGRWLLSSVNLVKLLIMIGVFLEVPRVLGGAGLLRIRHGVFAQRGQQGVMFASPVMEIACRGEKEGDDLAYPS
jgi:hypothetical protein